MHNIVIDKKGSQLSCQRNILLIQHQSFAKPLSIPLSQIQSLTITTQVDLSSNLLTRLSENAVSVCVLPSARSGEACFLLGSAGMPVQNAVCSNTTSFIMMSQGATGHPYWCASSCISKRLP
ncbi:CRISPR-associated endonuclease Cas1 [Psychrobacter sp. ANT_WB68]|uniref:CRISPR-associated endonuclease Cas1 n=1 Tax=Psychrobacter sp. ANT_WB68 TaxID=2597355 RepID=UPI0011F105FA|nr:CRISPR-associated endonuclease Cas1 [Psychrobacter sp. ANT_WB68]KAA0915590.1 hypothetical protein FQ084_03325 [Psychrobacter sp. ANT_WB68]